MGKRKSLRNHKLYKMKGCSKKTCKSHKKYLGGSTGADVNLAYTGNSIKTVANPFLAYTGKGGTTSLENVNGAKPMYPSTGPPPGGFNFLNPQNTQRGGSCGCGAPLMSGGNCSSCQLGFMTRGGASHRANCKCSLCKKNMTGGLGNNGIPYPNGLTGQSWSPSTQGWPGVDNISGNRNYLELNKYHNDVPTSIINTGANPPFLGGRKTKRNNRRKQKGGTLSNFFSEDLINLGRQFQYGLGSAYNGLAGYQAPVNPLPWKGQLPSTLNLSTVKATLI
jgi:hypothetical protein